MKIAVAGAGYVGLANAVLLARQHPVTVLEIDPARIDALRAGLSPVADDDIQRHLREGRLDLRATLDPGEAYRGADVVIVATPTDFDAQGNTFDTRSVQAVVREAVAAEPGATIVIRSTVPIGFTDRLREALGCGRILFSPEFLREGRALHDALHPSRIVVGGLPEEAAVVARLFAGAAHAPDVPVLLTGTAEAEAIKLFSNAYLALRVAFFNELDSYACTHDVDTRQVIEGVGLDPRIGLHYNNPSFGYGGYCLPKDTRQLLATFEGVPQALIGAIGQANAARMDFIADTVMQRKPRTVGIYRLAMKTGSDNHRNAAIQGVMQRLQGRGVTVLVHEPALAGREFEGARLVADLDEFKHACDLVVANRHAAELADIRHKVFSRDLFGHD
jgi:UDPglucose 6-dehydrogenase